MKNPILNLLFNPKGEINAKEFQAGLIILLFSAINLMIITLFSTVLILLSSSLLSVRELGLKQIFGTFISGLQPHTVPFAFIIFYSSMVLSIKRFRAFDLPFSLGILQGIITFLLFSVFTNLPYRLMFYSDKFSYSSDIMQEANLAGNLLIINAVLSIIILIAVITNILLAFIKSNKEKNGNIVLDRTETGLGQYAYIFNIGKIILISVLLNILIGAFLLALYSINIENDYVKFFAVIFYSIGFIIFHIFYLKASWKRLENVGYKGISVVVTFISFLLLIIGCFVAVYIWKGIYSNIIFSNALILFIALFQAGSFLLIILPKRSNFSI